MKLCISALFLAGLIGGAAVAASLPNVNAGVLPVNGVALGISSGSPEHTSISLAAPDVTMEDAVVDYQTYQVFRLQGEPVLFQEGAPAVPQISRFYRIPNTGGVDLQITDAEYDVIENVNPFPVQREDREFHGLVKDEAIYAGDAWYPANVAEVSAPMIMRDFRVVMVTLHPVQVNPVTHQARVYRTLNVELNANNQPGDNEMLHPRAVTASWIPIYESTIANLDDDDPVLDEPTVNPGGYLIICKNNASVLPWADSLALWKRRSGYDVAIDARPDWTAVSMITAIQNAYATWDPPLEFVCLMGDPDWTNGVPTDGNNFDHSFALGDGWDDLEDIGVGRLSGSSMAEMATINAKIMSYERNPWMEDSQGQADTMWFHRAALFAGYGMGVSSNVNLMKWARQQFLHFTSMDSVQIITFNNQSPPMPPYWTPGLAYFIWRGSWVGQIDPSFPFALPPGFRLPVTWTVECGTGDFVNGTCVAENMLRAGTPTSPRGGVCGIGSASYGSHATANVTLTGGFVYNLANLGTEHLGNALAGAKLWLSLTYGFGTQIANNHTRWTNLLGEPSLSMWTSVPVLMNVEHPAALEVGAHSVQITVRRDSTDEPVPDALVILWKGEETYARGLTDVNGTITLPIAISTPGDLLLTVTKHNHKPYLFTIPCGVSPIYVAPGPVGLDDDNVGGTVGNADGVMNPGEIIDLLFHLHNYGNSYTATNVSAQLNSENEHVTVLNGAVAAPDIPPGDSVSTNLPFRIEISPAMHDGEVARLMMTVYATQDTTASLVELVCRAGTLIFMGYETDGPLDPGAQRSMTLTLRNTGVQVLNGVNGQLSSLSPLVQVLDGAGYFGVVQPGFQANNSGDPFALSISPSAFRGQPATMQLIASVIGGAPDTMTFSIFLGTATASDPTGPDGYGYFAFDNSDTGYVEHPTFAYIDISNGPGTNLNLNQPDTSCVRPLPFLFVFYGQSYDSLTICNNGWAAFGDQSWNWAFRNYPIPGILAPDAMIAPYWDDLATSGPDVGVWVYDDAANHRFVVQWKAHGANSTIDLDFELILLDEEAYPTPDGNGKVLVQYQEVSMELPPDPPDVAGCTIGISAPGSLVGLQYVYIQTYASGAAQIDSGRAILFTTSTQTGTDLRPHGVLVPTAFDLHQNYPNPFNPTTEIRFDVPTAGRVLIEVYNTLGQPVGTLVDGEFNAGTHHVTWNGNDAASGIYFCRMQAGSYASTRKMVLMR